MTTAATVAPLSVISGKISWTTALLAGLFAALYIIIYNSGARTTLAEGVRQCCGAWSGLVFGAYGLATGMLTAYAAAMSIRAYPEEGMFPWLPLALLVISAWVASKGSAAVARFAGILAALTLPLLAVVLAFGATEVKVKNLSPTLYIEGGWAALAVGLLPMAGIWFRKSEKKVGTAWILAPIVASVAISLVTIGTLGTALAQSVDEPFYMATKSITLFVVMERFEGLVAAVLLLGFGCLLAYLGAIGGEIWKAWMPEVSEKLAPLPNLVVALVTIWWVGRLEDWVPGVLVLVFWAVLPPVFQLGTKGE